MPDTKKRGGDTIDLPRWQDGKKPQHLLITILGDFWVGRPEPLPSATLVQLLEEFDVSEDSARAALSRLARRGVLTATKRGRNTFYKLAESASGDTSDTGAEVMSFGGSDDVWTGRWTLCAFSLPESRRETRNQLRTRLRSLGFAPLYDGLWASAFDHRDTVLTLFDELDVEQGSVFIAKEIIGKDRQGIESLWNLDLLREHYEAFLAEWGWIIDRIRNGDVTPKEAFVVRTTMNDTYRRFPRLDPGLPDSALPDDWPRARLRALFLQAYEELASLATLRVQQIVSEHAPELAAHVHTHSAKRVKLGTEGVYTCPDCDAADPLTNPPTDTE